MLVTRRCDHAKPKGEGVQGPGFTVKLHQDPGVCASKKKGVGGASWLGRYSEQRSEDLLCQAVKATQCGLDITLLIRGFGHYSCW